jgi:hypothetical protein
VKDTTQVNEPPEPLTAEQIARATDAINFTLVAFGVPDEHRTYIDALIGASSGCLDWFEMPDIAIAQRAREVSTQALKQKSLEKWTQREREEFSEWQRARKITLVEAMPGGRADGVNYKSQYRVAALFQIAIETDRRARLTPGFEKNPKRALRKAAAVVVAEFRAKPQEPAKRNRFRKSRRTCDTYLKLIDTYLNNLCGQALIERKNLPKILEDIELAVYQRRIKCAGFAPLPNRVQTEQAQADSSGVGGDNLSPAKNGQNETFVHTSLEEKAYGQTVAPRPPVGQDRDEFLSETFPAELDVDDDAESGPTPRMRELIERTGHIVPESFSEASALIGELIAANAFSTFLSLEELRLYDAGGGREQGTNKRWCCPLCRKTITGEHRDLSVDIHTGEYHCFVCHTGGVLREYLGASGSARVFTPAPQEQKPKSDKWRTRFEKAKPVAGTPGASYLEGRGVPLAIAEAANVRYGPWPKGDGEWFDAVQFPLLDADGNLVAVTARSIEGKTMRTGGERSRGVFLGSPDALGSVSIAVCESPIDSLILEAAGLRAIALGGTSWPEWLPGVLEDKDVALATDADQAGDECAAKLSALLVRPWRLRPDGAKDFGELAEAGGLDAVITTLERAPVVEVAR